MDKAQFIQKRKGRYMAQILEKFEEEIEPLIDLAECGPQVSNFKALVRMRLDALANDAVDLFALGNGAVNGAAQAVRDTLSPVGRP